jgi:ethanolamine ammonia-lyase large subunit
LREEAATQIAEVRDRGVFIAEGHAERMSDLPAELDAQINEIYADAKQCIWAELPADFESLFTTSVSINTLSKDRNDYILHPTSGEELSESSQDKLQALRDRHGEMFDTVIVLSDGLNALANTTDGQAVELIQELRRELAVQGRTVFPELLVVRAGRVRAGYRIGENLFGNRVGRFQVLHVVGERPGSGHRTLSIYITSASGDFWGVPSKVDHNITKVVSGIARSALLPVHGAEAAARILRTMG